MKNILSYIKKENKHTCDGCNQCDSTDDLLNDAAHNNPQKYYHVFDEYPEFIKEYNKLTNNSNIFDSFTDKIKNHTINIDEIITLNTLAQGVVDDTFREFLYQKIIDELIIYCFVGRK